MSDNAAKVLAKAAVFGMGLIFAGFLINHGYEWSAFALVVILIIGI